MSNIENMNQQEQTDIDVDSLYLVTFRNGTEATMTGPCLLHCYLNSVDDSVASYVETFCYLKLDR